MKKEKNKKQQENNSKDSKQLVKAREKKPHYKLKLVGNIFAVLILVAIIIAAYILINWGIEQLEIPDADFTADKIYSITQPTKDKLEGLNKDVTITLINMNIYTSVVDLTNQYANLNDHIKVEKIDDISIRPDLESEYGLTSSDSVLLFESDGKNKIVQTYDLVTYDSVTYATIDKTEEAITNAILDVTVEDRPVKNGDITVIDFAGSVDGVPFDGGTAEDYELEIGSHSFIEGFEDQMVGMKIDEEKDINVTFPEDYFSKELAGKPAVFKVTVHEIKEKQIPAIDDELAKDASEFDTLKEWEASIKKNMQEQNDHKAKHEMEDAVIKKIVENAEFEVPSGMIDSEIDMRIRSFENNLYYQGLTLEKYLELVHQSMSDLRNNLKESAEEAVRTQLVLEAVSKELGDKVKPDDEKIKANMKE